jgi:drug/metabolite transporter (DMT)-like permease
MAVAAGSPSSLSGLLIASVPIIVAVLAWLTGGSDRLTVTRWAGLLAGLAGVALLAGQGADWPITEVPLVAMCYAIGPLIASRKLSGLPPVGMTAVCLAFAAVVYAPLAALTWTSALPSAKSPRRGRRPRSDLHRCRVPRWRGRARGMSCPIGSVGC